METYLDALIRAAIEEALASHDEGTFGEIMHSVRGRVEYASADSWTDGLLAEIERLRSVVDRIPHFEDGAPALPGDKVFPLHPIEPGDHGVLVWALKEPDGGEILEHGDGEFWVGLNFSSEEAATAAREVELKETKP